MAFTPKDWQDAPSLATPISAEALEDLEVRVTDYTDDVVVATAGTTIVANTTLTGAASAGASSITASATAPTGFVAIEPYSTNCEVRRISSISGSTINLSSALSFSHSNGVRAILFESGSVPVGWWGAKGDNSTDDIAALQAAVESLANAGTNQTLAGLALDGAGRGYLISQPWNLPNHTAIQRFVISARSNYAPGDLNGAMVMTYRPTTATATISVTAAASTDTFTSSVAHGLGTGSQVTFKGGSLPGGITAGKVYFVVATPTSTTFQVSSSNSTDGGGNYNGAVLDITADGSASLYTNMQALCRAYWRDIYLSGSNIANVSGARMDLQQPAHFENVRIDNCPGTGGLIIFGQQAVFYNVELIGNARGLYLDGMEFAWFWGINAEQSTSSHIYVSTKGAVCCKFSGVHFESGTGPAAIDIAGGTAAFDFDNVQWTAGSSTQNLIHAHVGSPTGYSIRNVNMIVNDDITTNHQTIIQDDDRSETVISSHPDDHIQYYETVPVLQSALSQDKHLHTLIGSSGKRVRYFPWNNGVPTFESRPGTDQTSSQYRWLDKTGAVGSDVNKDGYFTTQKHSAPADADLASGELAWWFDQTNGSPQVNFKGKSADGTVFTKQVAGTGGGSGTPSGRARLISGSYIGPMTSPDGSGAALSTLGAMCGVPIYVPSSTTFTRIGVNVVNGGGAGVVVRLGIYLDDGVTGPNNLIVDAGATIDMTVVNRQEITINQTLAAGIYWLVGVSQVAGASRGNVARLSSATIANGWAIPQGYNANFTAQPTGFLRTGITGALPATLTPARADYETSGDMPFIYLKVA